MATADLTAQRLRELLHYDPETGVFTWIASPRKSIAAGAEAGCVPKPGRKGKYIVITIDKSHHYAHRLAWLYVTGGWPTNNIDHKNGDRFDNRFANLRDVSQRVNRENQTVCNRNNVLGVLGVRKIGMRFYSKIRARGKVHALGGYPTPEEAHDAYMRAKVVQHDVADAAPDYSL